MARRRRGTKPSRGKNRNVREGNEVKMLLASSNKSLTQTDTNLSEENFHQTGRSEEGQTPRYSNYRTTVAQKFHQCLSSSHFWWPLSFPVYHELLAGIKVAPAVPDTMTSERGRGDTRTRDSHGSLDGHLGWDWGVSLHNYQVRFSPRTLDPACLIGWIGAFLVCNC